MVNNNKAHRTGIRAALSATLFLIATSASAVVVDGNLTDLISAIGAESAAPGNTAVGSESGTDAESNGFDITNAYAWYNVANDTFYVGMKFLGQVGTAGGNEGVPFSFCGDPTPNDPNGDGLAGVFDSCENYGFSVAINSGPNATVGFTRLDIIGDGILDTDQTNTGQNTELYPLVTGGLGGTFKWGVSESANGVEFSVSGLKWALGDFSLSNPTNVTIGFYSGTADNFGPEDEFYMDMQVVPLPPAVLLLGSGLLGLIGFSRKHRTGS